jgi:hypothetical protein
LAATVNSLEGSIDNAVNTALADGLADINAAVAELESQIDNIASGEDVDAINSTLDGLETDLDELLASNNIYSSDLIINSTATLEFAENLKGKVSIVNGNVFIEQSSEMDSVRLQTVASKIKTITGDLVIRAQTSSVGGITLDSLTGVSNLKVAQAGSISFPLLESAQEIVFGNNYRVDGAVDFKALTSVTKFVSGSIADGTNTYASFAVGSAQNNTIELTKAASINLSGVKYYTPRNLTINADDDTALNLSSLESKDANGRARSYTLSVKGAKALHVPGLVEGTVTVEDVEDVTLEAFTGKITVKAGVLNVDLGALKNDFDATAATDLVAVDLTMDAADKKADFTGATDLETASIAGKVKTVTFSGNSNLTQLTLTAAIESLTIHNTDLAEATIDYTNANLAEKGSLVITDNKDLTALYADKVDGLATLTITGNDELTSVSFDALKAVPTKATVNPVVKIGGTTATANDLNADLIDQNETDHTKGGSFTTDSGLDDLKTYLAEADKRTGSDLRVFFDRADEYTVDGTVQTPPSGGFKIGGAHDRALTVINSFGQSGAGKSKRTWIISGNATSTPATLSLTANTIVSAINVSTPGIDNVFAVANSTAFKSPFANVGTLTVSQGADPAINLVLTGAPTTALISVTTASSTSAADKVEAKIGDYTSIVYLTTANDPNFTNTAATATGKKSERQLVVGAGTQISDVLGQIAAGFGNLSSLGMTATASASAVSATLEIRANDISTKHHNTTKVSYSSSNAAATDLKASYLDVRGIKRTTLYGYGVQITLEAKTAGETIRNGGPSEIGDPPSTTGFSSLDNGTGAGQAQLTYAGSTAAVTELGKSNTSTPGVNDSPDAVAFGASTASGTDVNHVTWL